MSRTTAVAVPPHARVPLFALALAVLALLGLVVAVPHELTLSADQLLVALALVAATATAESLVLHVEIGDSARTASLTELPLVLGLLWLDPLLLVAVRLVGAALCLGLGRRQSASKLWFNLADIAGEVVLALLVLNALHGTEGSLVHRWAVVLVACLASSAFTGMAVVTGMSLEAGRPLYRELPVLPRVGVVIALVAGTLGVLAAQAVDADATAVVPLVLLALLCAYAYRGHTGLRRSHDRLSSLYGFVRGVSGAVEADGAVRAVLVHTVELLRGEVAVLTQVMGDEPGQRRGLHLLVHRLEADGTLVSTRQLAGPDDWPVARCLSSDQSLLAPRGSRDPAVTAYLEHTGVRDCVLVAVPGPEAASGTLFVGSRRSEHSTFEPADVLALEGLAGHAAVALQNSTLVDRLTHESRHDLLTGLPNRTEFLARLSATLAGPHRATAVLLMDLDRFKDVNDTLGHAAGDRLLQRVSERLSASVAVDCTVARLGGDEFAVVLPRHDSVTGLQVAARLRAELEQPVDVDGLFVDVGVSIGIASSPEHGDDASQLMRHADIAMYDGKAGNGLAVYDPERDDSSKSRLALVAQLRNALAEGQFALHYQPQVDGAGHTAGFEALLRWYHPQRGLVPPDDFIPVAERAGLLQDLTSWVLRTALDAMVLWREAGCDLAVAVNLSPRNLLDPGLPSRVRRELASRGLPPERLTLEITEGTIMAEPARAVETLRQLRGTGVRLSIDDFGTGYSSLAYLKQLPVDEVKIDKSFVRELATDEAGVAIVRAVLALSASLGLDVVAEGVEDEPSRQRLADMGCGLLQGFHLSRPMPEGDVLPWLQENDLPARQSATVLPLPVSMPLPLRGVR